VSTLKKYWNHFLFRETRLYENPFTPDPLNFENFQSTNFIIIENLCSKNVFSGHLTLNLKFDSLLDDKTYMVYIPIYQKKVSFDDSLNAMVGDMTAEEAAHDDRKFLSKHRADIC